MSEQSLLPQSPPPAPSAAQAERKYSTLAIASLVCGLLTWFSIPLMFLVLPTPLCTLAAIICGHMARAELRRDPALQGDGMAIAGLVLGWGMVLSMVVAVLAVLLLFGGVAALLAFIGHAS